MSKSLTDLGVGRFGKCNRLFVLLVIALSDLGGAGYVHPHSPAVPLTTDPQPTELRFPDVNEWLRTHPFPPGSGEGPPNIQFERLCATCHGKIEAAPTVEHLRSLSPDTIYEKLTTGSMKDIAPDLNDEGKRSIAVYLAGTPMIGAPVIDKAANECLKRPALRHGLSPKDWAGWSPDSANTRFQEFSGLTPSSVRRLRLKWAFAAPNASSMYGQPVVDAGRVYITDDTGSLYSLDAATGCTYWIFKSQTYSRGAPVIAQLGEKKIIFLGDVAATGYAIDAATGQQLWAKKMDSHPLARMAASPVYSKGRVYFPIGALEEIVSMNPTYTCCTSRGSIVAVDALTGEQIWKSYAIDAPAVLQDKQMYGRPYWGPSGASVWGTPTIDTKRNRLYFGTGNLFAEPETGDADAIHAIDLSTGKTIWKRQTFKNDFFAGGTISTGPDFDFSASPMLLNAKGSGFLLAGQKSGDVWALNPDDGRVIWHRDVNRAHAGGIKDKSTEILFGGAADSSAVYYGLRSGAIVSIALSTGKENWLHDVSALPSSNATASERRGGISAAVSLIPGVLFTGGLDGSLRAFSTKDGSALWSFDTNTPVTTVNGVAGKGGSIGNPGPVIAEGMLFASSGYVGFQRGNGGNLLLVFAPQ